MRVLRAASIAACVGLLMAVGCGTGDDLFTQGTPIDSSGSGTTEGSSSGGSSSTSMSTSGTPSTSTGMTSASGGGNPVTTSTTSGMGGMGTGAGGPGGGDPVDFLDCGDSVCPVGGNNACCYDHHEQYEAPFATCVMGDIENDGCQTGYDANPGFETRIECQSEDHCGGGDVCCARIAYSPTLNNNVYVELSCTDENDCVEPPQNEFRGLVVCDSLGSTAGCPMIFSGGGGMVQSVCKDSAPLPEGYLSCGTAEG